MTIFFTPPVKQALMQMAEKTPRIPNVLRQPLSVDFIDNELPKVDDAFRNLPIRYDPVSEQFVGIGRAATMPAGPTCSTAPGQGFASPGHLIELTSQKGYRQYCLPTTDVSTQGRKRLPMVGAMKFWNNSRVFQEAMASFARDKPNEPKQLKEKPGYCIRKEKSWNDVCDKLGDAKKKFDGGESKSWSIWIKRYRAFADKNSEARWVIDQVPDSDYVTPVKAILGLVLETIKNASDARTKATATFNDTGIMELFAKVEEFLDTFKEDEIIFDLCVDLVASIFKAVEVTIVYFLSSAASRIIKAIPLFGNGQKPLRDAITEIETKSQKLIDEARTSQMVKTRQIHETVDRTEVRLGNYMSKLMNDGALDHERLTGIEEENHRQATMLEDVQKSIQDISKEVKRHNIQQNGCIQTAVVPPTLPLQQSPQLLPHLPSLYPTYPYWGHPQNTGDQPLSYLSANHHTTLQQQTPDPILVVDTLLNTLGTPRPNLTSVEDILASADSIDLKRRSRVNQIVKTEEFHAWATSPHSRELLIQGDPAQDVTQAGPALTLLSATLIQSIQNQERFVSLVFFCVQQLQEEDVFVGPAAMIRSLIVQLLNQCYVNSTFFERDIDRQGLQTGDIDALCSLFKFLVWHVAPQKTIVCVIDGVGEYENGEYEDGLRRVLDCMLGLVRDEDVPPAVKVLVICHTGTVKIHNAFKDDVTNFLSVEGLTSIGDDGAILDLENEF
ncbi:hypothetical protein F4803DRAFT_509502 [Xylaria telfairii]|nr:hypothetical protein F4803DRAFT_509502 [Xylaria telfairii]